MKNKISKKLDRAYETFVVNDDSFVRSNEDGLDGISWINDQDDYAGLYYDEDNQDFIFISWVKASNQDILERYDPADFPNVITIINFIRERL